VFLSSLKFSSDNADTVSYLSTLKISVKIIFQVCEFLYSMIQKQKMLVYPNFTEKINSSKDLKNAKK
jgi:hypothetical protein